MQEQSFRWQHRDAFETNPLFANYRGEAYFRKKLLLVEISVLSVKE